jgi:hypothetical protein
MQLTFLTGVGSQTFDFGATQFQIRALSTVDLQRTKADVPVRIHSNIGAIVDGSGSLLTQPLSNAERFAPGASDFNRFVFGLGVEVPVKYVTPYLEYSLDVPLGYLATPGIVLIGAARQGLRSAQTANESIAADPGRPALPRVIPQKLTPGIRVTAIPDLTIDAAVEISLTSDYAPGVLAIAPYNVMFLFTYALDPFSKRSGPPVTIPVVVPEPTPIEPPPTTGHVTGVVLAQDGKPVEDAVITFDRAPPVATGNTEAGGRLGLLGGRRAGRLGARGEREGGQREASQEGQGAEPAPGLGHLRSRAAGRHREHRPLPLARDRARIGQGHRQARRL